MPIVRMVAPPSLPTEASLAKVWQDYCVSNGIWQSMNSVKKTKKSDCVSAATNWYNEALVAYNEWENSGIA